MIGFDPHSARRPGASVPTRRAVRVEPASDAARAGDDAARRALVPVKPAPSAARRSTARGPDARSPVAARCANAGLLLQTELAQPRRGLRADAVERARYRAAYETAGRPAAARPVMERRA